MGMIYINMGLWMGISVSLYLQRERMVAAVERICKEFLSVGCLEESKADSNQACKRIV